MSGTFINFTNVFITSNLAAICEVSVAVSCTTFNFLVGFTTIIMSVVVNKNLSSFGSRKHWTLSKFWSLEVDIYIPSEKRAVFL